MVVITHTNGFRSGTLYGAPSVALSSPGRGPYLLLGFRLIGLWFSFGSTAV